MIGQTISHYRILEKLGEGGMGVVYKAKDIALGRLVALKFLGELISLDPSALRRFEREARLASSLTHPNICTIHEIGNHEGRLFIAMELLAGQPLRRLLGDGPLDETTVVDVGVQVADALDTAHQQGIVHRDIKPENIFVNEKGLAKILDFGLVKRLPVEGSRLGGKEGDLQEEFEGTEDDTLTLSGALMGTVEYMSPEQVRGEQVDHRSDLFSLGVVLYEMATGAPPFRGRTAAVVTDGILNRSPVPPARLNPDLSPALEAIIDKALAKEPGHRYQHAAELRIDLERVKRAAATDRTPTSKLPWPTVGKRTRIWRLLAVTAVLAAALTGLWYRRDDLSPRSKPLEASVAVLPFEDLSPEGNQQYFSDGLTEELLANLGKIPGLRVTGRTSSFRFRGGSDDLRVVGRKLSVATVLDGSVRRYGDRVRITAELIDSADGFQLWSETFDRQVGDLFELQEEIARSVARTLQVRLLGEPTSTPPTHDAAAHNAYLQGQYFYQRQTRENLEKATGYFEQAIQLDPGYARAWGALGATLAFQAAVGYVPPTEGYSRARAAVQQALALDPRQPRAHAVMGWIQMTYDWDWPGAAASFEQAQALDPGRGLLEAALLEVALGRFDRGLELAYRTVELDPFSPQALSALAVAAWYGGRTDEALSTYARLLELVPESAGAHSLAAQVHLTRSEPERALEEIEKEKEPFFQLSGLALVYHALGRHDESEAALAQFITRFQESGALQIAEVYASYGDADRSMEWLERAYDQRDGGLFLVAVDPFLKSLASDPRYRDLVARMGLTERAREPRGPQTLDFDG